jgi:hypothetical protein
MRTRSIILSVAAVALSVATVAAQTAQAGQAAQVAPAAGGRGAAPTPASCGPNPPAELKNVAKGSRCFELRTYTVRAESPGNADMLHARFREHTLPIFKRLGMEVVGFWQPVSKPDTLIYMLAFKDAATRDELWAKFAADPEWIKARTEMQVSSQVTNEFMIATDYGPMK